MSATEMIRAEALPAPNPSAIAVHIKGLYKWFGDFQVLRGVDLDVRRGERIVICGPSGSGKSTVLRCINGLEPFQRGELVVDGISLGADLKRIAEVRREVGMVFQQFNLFPHLTVLENCMLAPLQVRKMPRAQAEENSATPTSARMSLSGDQSGGRNNGSITLAMNRTVISGTPRTISMKITARIFTAGMDERRPSASRMPSGSETTIPTLATTTVISMPPQREVSTISNPSGGKP